MTLRLTLCALLLSLAGCGDDDGVGDDAAMPTDAQPGPDTAVPLDQGEPPEDAGPSDCLPCRAEGPPWTCERCLPTPLQEVTAAVLDGAIVVAGGFESVTAIVPTVRRFDPAAGTWSELPALPAPRHHLSLVAMDGDLYAIGGMADLGFEALDTAWVLRDGASSWESIASLPMPRAAATAAAIDGEIVVAGGQGVGAGDDAKLAAAAAVLRYDPVADEWTAGASIPTPREHLAGFAHDGELWALGGRSIDLEPTLAVVEVYDPVADEWRAGPAMPTPHGGFAAAVLDEVAYVGGGEESDRALTSFEALDLTSGGWSTLAPIPTPRHGHAMAAAAGKVYVIGGADSPVFAAVETVESYAP